MIYIEMYGRLGNQFFRYAAARAVQLKYYPNEKLIFNFQQINDLHKKDPTFYNVLNDFCVADYEVYHKNGKVLKNETNLFQKIVCAFYYRGLKKIKTVNMTEQVSYERKWLPILNNAGIYWFRTGYCKIKKSKFKNKFLSGGFESPDYFENIREILLKEFKPKHNLLEKNISFLKKIKETNSICLSVRRGDFENDNKIKALHSVCDKNYFLKAIEIIKQKINDPVFFLFSDDIEWVKENINTGCETYYEDGTDPVWEKIRLMSACKHFIISNSTFSWWCQWLSTNKDKIVVSPSHWFNNDYDSPLISKNWIQI
jgi:hypothetical protein